MCISKDAIRDRLRQEIEYLVHIGAAPDDINEVAKELFPLSEPGPEPFYIPQFDSSWTDQMLAHLEVECLFQCGSQKEYEQRLIASVPALCQSWGDYSKRDRVMWVINQLPLTAATREKCEELIDLPSAWGM